MNAPRKFWPLTLLIETIILVFLWTQIRLLPDGKFHAHFLDVGQGDSILLVTPSGKQILIDGGPDLSTLQRLGQFMPVTDRMIDLVVLTHPDLDHVTALPAVLARYRVGSVLLTGVDAGSARYREFLSLVRQKNIPVIVPDPAQDIDMGDGVLLDIVWPQPVYFGQKTKDTNDTSIVMRALYGEHSILLTGDAEKNEEEDILASRIDIRSDILKVGHHGSRTSSSTGFLLAIKPSVAIISAGKNNSFGHPHWDVVERLERMGIEIRRTDREGTVSLSF